MPHHAEQLADLFHNFSNTSTKFSLIGNAKSYGDNYLSKKIISLDRFPRKISYSQQDNSITASANITIFEILLFLVKYNRKLAVIPGTKYVTLSGALSNNVHGKNCFVNGSIGEHVKNFKIMIPSGEILLCSRFNNQDLFYSVIGGFGLLGCILEVTLETTPLTSLQYKTKNIKLNNLRETLLLGDSSLEESQYLIANVDNLTNQKRSSTILSISSTHDNDTKQFKAKNSNFDFKEVLNRKNYKYTQVIINRYTLYLFNKLYFNLLPTREKVETLEQLNYLMDLNLPFYNKLFRNGFYEYQVIVEHTQSLKCFKEIRQLQHQSKNFSYMSALKWYRRQEDPFLNNFSSKNGHSMTYDIPKSAGNAQEQYNFFLRLNDLLIKHGGRVYLAKSSPITKEQLFEMYPYIKDLLVLKQKYDPKEVLSTSMFERIMKL